MKTNLLLCLAALVAGLALATSAGAQSGDTIKIIAIDADISGNTATSLGPLNACTRVEPGGSVTLDLVVDAVPASRGIIGYQFNITYDPAILELTAADNEFLLGANGAYAPFEGLSEPLPDSDGDYLIIMADIASDVETGASIESGPGVIARLTFKARAPGVSAVAPRFDPPEFYPAVIDTQNTTIGVDSVAGALVAVGQECPVPPDSTPAASPVPPIEQYLGLEPTVAATPGPGGEPSPGASASPGASPASSPAAGASPTPTPHATPPGGPGAVDLTEGDGGGLSAGAVIAIVLLGVAGAGAIAGGALLLARRRGAAPGGDAGA